MTGGAFNKLPNSSKQSYVIFLTSLLCHLHFNPSVPAKMRCTFPIHILVIALCFPLLALAVPTASPYQLPPDLDPKILKLVRRNAINISTHSWELGALAEALTEYEWPELAVFTSGSIPPSTQLNGLGADVLSIAEKVVANKTPGMLPLINGDGAVGDPASLGVAVLLRNWTLPSYEASPYRIAAEEQLKYLLKVAPRASNGAISQRESQVQLWSDYVYMAPPFIAYYGALKCGHEGKLLLHTAYEQVKSYREVLFDRDVGLWRHIALGEGTDPTHWGTGNAWAAAGALRVLATIQGSSAAESMKSQQEDLACWVRETLDGVWKFQQANGTLLNYIDQPDSFADSSSTALLAAATFRYASITGDTTHISAAICALQLIRNSVDRHGWLLNTVDPLQFSVPSGPSQHSPEGQSFVLLLEAAVSVWGSSYYKTSE